MFQLLTIYKHGHQYVFRYKNEDEATLIQVLISKAEDINCPLDWFDAAVLCHKICKFNDIEKAFKDGYKK